MAKILLVEDDFSLRDIYSARIQADGHAIVTASDGEEALAVAMREHPDLIILDVMMPKISGFDVLDILRSTPETKTTKVIMMTALSQDTDRKRGEALGVNKYLVKSQVTLEDVMSTVNQVLAGTENVSPPAPPAPTPAPVEVAAPAEETADPTPEPAAVVDRPPSAVADESRDATVVEPENPPVAPEAPTPTANPDSSPPDESAPPVNNS